jgi:hypothetical protein
LQSLIDVTIDITCRVRNQIPLFLTENIMMEILQMVEGCELEGDQFRLGSWRDVNSGA